MEKKRLTAMKTRIKPVISGTFVAQPGFESNYVLTDTGMRLSRIRVMGTVVDKFLSESGKLASITLDDGTATIRAKAFNSVSFFDKVGIGDTVDIVGRLRQYQGETFIVPDVVKKVDDINWELLRELELRKQKNEWDSKRNAVLEHQKQSSDMDELKRVMKERLGIDPADVEAIVQSLGTSEEENQEDKQKEAILKFIEELDSGEGCDYSELIGKSGLPEDAIESIVNELLGEGSCFEPKPGKIKKL